MINADGTGLRDVVARYSPEAGFAWSPDGGQLAFFEDPGLYVEDADGANRRLLARCDCRFDSQVAWSPDGGMIAYSDSTQIHLVHPDGTGKRTLTQTSTGGALSPELSWSPDGNQIAFTRPPFPYVRGSDGTERANTAEPDLYVISTDGSGELRLGLGKGPVWSPDGGRIAFIRERVVYAIDSDGSGERRLGRGDYHLSWSPSGTQIAVRRDFGRPSPGSSEGLPDSGRGRFGCGMSTAAGAVRSGRGKACASAAIPHGNPANLVAARRRPVLRTSSGQVTQITTTAWCASYSWTARTLAIRAAPWRVRRPAASHPGRHPPRLLVRYG